MDETLRIAERLCDLSIKSFSQLPAIADWPEAAPEDGWYMSPELVSLHGTDAYAALGEAQQKRLSFFEAVSFFSLNIHGEKFLLAGLCDQLYGRSHQPSYAYLHHFIDEENKHLHYFGSFCTRYAGKVYPDKKLSFPREYERGEADFLLFARIVVFEELVDFYNVQMAGDERLVPLVRTMNRLHHQDEVRHLAFGRVTTRELWDRWSPTWSDAARARVKEYVAGYVAATLREYVNPDAYRDAGLSRPHDLADLAFEAGEERRRRAARKVVAFLRESGILETDPTA